jgi:hypothetical protein
VKRKKEEGAGSEVFPWSIVDPSPFCCELVESGPRLCAVGGDGCLNELTLPS